MMKKNKLFIVFLATIILFALGTISYGACSVPNKTVDSGKEFTLSISSNVGLEDYGISLSSHGGIEFISCSGGSYANNGKISYASVGNPITSLGTYKFKAPDVTEDKTYSIKFVIEADNDETLTSTITVKAPEKQADPKPAEEIPPATTETPSTTTEAPVQETPKEEPKLSSNSKLKMLGIRPNDFSNFKSSVTTYYVTVPYEVSKVEVYAEKQEKSQKISGTTDSMSLKVGSNTAKVTCTAEDGTTKTYTIYITREEEVKETVKEEPEEETPPVVEEIKTEEETDVAEFIGKEKVLGITAIKVIAKVEEGKDYEPELMPEFREAEYEYQVTVPLTATEVEVNVESDTEATIEVMGNKDLKEGINNVTVMVKIGEDTKIYQIVVNKVEMKPVSTLSDELISQLAVIAAIATAIIVAIIVLIIAIIRSRKKNKVVESDAKVETAEQMQEENMDVGQEQKDENKEE